MRRRACLTDGDREAKGGGSPGSRALPLEFNSGRVKNRSIECACSTVAVGVQQIVSIIERARSLRWLSCERGSRAGLAARTSQKDACSSQTSARAPQCAHASAASYT